MCDYSETCTALGPRLIEFPDTSAVASVSITYIHVCRAHTSQHALKRLAVIFYLQW